MPAVPAPMIATSVCRVFMGSVSWPSSVLVARRRRTWQLRCPPR